MVDRIHLGRDDRETIQDIIRFGLKHHEQWGWWTVGACSFAADVGLARSADIPKGSRSNEAG